MAEASPAASTRGRRRGAGFELALVIIVAFAALAPGIGRYSLVDPWETHYGEVARLIRQNHDGVHLDWAGSYLDPNEHEGFRSKPVLSFWLMAASMRLLGVAQDGGYSGEMVASPVTMVAVRLPFIVMAVLGLTLMWWMLARLVSRRLAWLGLLVVGSTPMFALIARQAIPDMPHLACLIGALALFVLAVEDGDRPIGTAFTLRLGRRRIAVSALHVFLALVGGFVLVQCVYYVVYFIVSPGIVVRRFPNPVVFFPLLTGLLFGGLSRFGWLCVRFPSVIAGSAIAFVVSPRRFTVGAFDAWDIYAPDRALIRALAFPFVRATGGSWAATASVAERALAMSPLTTMRQLYLLWAFAFVGFGILAKGPPGLAVFCVVVALYIVLLHRWRDLYDGRFEIKRGLLLTIVVFLPWHIAMFLKEGPRYVSEYLYFHILNRGGAGVDDSVGTFATLTANRGGYAAVIGHGMMLWAALLPAALAASLLRARSDTREGRVRFIVTLWALGATTLFFVIATKFNHYILPAIPALGLLVAFFLDDLVAGRDRLHPIYAALGIGIVLLFTRDLVWEPERWIEMFVYRYDRPWPWAKPHEVDLSDGFLCLGLISAVALAIAALPWRRVGVAALGVAGLATCIWALHIYMPNAATHWGMREAIRTYYEQRRIYGDTIVYFSPSQLRGEWSSLRHTFETFVPYTLYLGQPMTTRIQLANPEKQQQVYGEAILHGTVTRIGDHEIEITYAADERAKLAELAAKGNEPARRRSPIRAVDADRLIGWQMYWRGENFWSGNEVSGPLPEMRTQFNKNDNVAFRAYFNDRAKSPLGRRYFIISEAGRAEGARSLVPTERAKESFEVVNTVSNKFTLVAFYL